MNHKIDGGLSAARTLETLNRIAKPQAGSERGDPVGAIAATDSVRLTGEAEGLQALERQLGAAPAAIDMTRVNSVRAAIDDGSYRIDPQAIATRMLDFERGFGE
jgi:negative regulator of flagellin synthesis FlgM